MARKRQELQEELHRIEQRCLRQRGPNFKDEQENHHVNQEKGEVEIKTEIKEEDKGSKRNKFAMDVDDKEDTDGDDNHEAEETTDNNETMAENGHSGKFVSNFM